MATSLYLNQPANGFYGLITSIDGDMATRRKLMSLGLRQGQKVNVLHQRRNGVVVMSNGSRIALGVKVAGQIQLKAIDNEDC